MPIVSYLVLKLELVYTRVVIIAMTEIITVAQAGTKVTPIK